MKRGEIPVELVGPSGDRESWTLRISPLRRGMFGETDWVNRVLTVNSRLQSPESIYSTLLHEIVHVTTGQNGSEELAVNTERNYVKARRMLAAFLEGTTS